MPWWIWSAPVASERQLDSKESSPWGKLQLSEPLWCVWFGVVTCNKGSNTASFQIYLVTFDNTEVKAKQMKACGWCGISLCMLWLPLVNKELLWAYDRVDQRKVGKTKLNAGRRKVESKVSHGAAARDRCDETADSPWRSGNVQINGDGLN